MEEIYRQGDVILRKIDELPEWVSTRTPYVTEVRVSGETGHAHVIKGKVYGYGGVGSYIVLEKPTELEHEQHENQVIPPGIYQVDAVRDYRNIVESRNSGYGYD